MDIQAPLVPDVDDAHCKETDKWSCTTSVGILQYLSRNAHPNIKLDVNQFAHHIHNPKLSYDITIKRIFRYLKVTRDEGLVFNPTNILNIYFYADSEFSGLWHVENPE